MREKKQCARSWRAVGWPTIYILSLPACAKRAQIKLILFLVRLLGCGTFRVLFVKSKVGSFLWPMNSKFLALIDASHVSPKLFQTSRQVIQ